MQTEQKKPISSSLKRYVIVGTGGRSSMFSEALMTTYKDSASLVGLCDVNAIRMDYYNTLFKDKYGADPVPTYPASDFDRMLKEQKPDVVIVTCIDRGHHQYIIRALEAGCDAITEKPMTTDIQKCKSILETVERTGRSLRVAFNYR